MKNQITLIIIFILSITSLNAQDYKYYPYNWAAQDVRDTCIAHKEYQKGINYMNEMIEDEFMTELFSIYYECRGDIKIAKGSINEGINDYLETYKKDNNYTDGHISAIILCLRLNKKNKADEIFNKLKVILGDLKPYTEIDKDENTTEKGYKIGKYKHGKVKIFYPSGKVKYLGEYYLGKKNGLWSLHSDILDYIQNDYLFENGTLKEDSEYWLNSKKKHFINKYENNEILCYVRTERGKQFFLGKKANNLKEDEWFDYYPDGKLYSKGMYRNGFEIGTHYVFDYSYTKSKQNLRQKKEFKNNKYYEENYYDKTGVLKDKGYWSKKSYKSIEFERKHKIGNWIGYYENGKIKYKCNYDDNGEGKMYRFSNPDIQYTDYLNNRKKTIAETLIEIENSIGIGSPDSAKISKAYAKLNTIISKVNKSVTIKNNYSRDDALTILNTIGNTISGENITYGNNFTYFMSLTRNILDCDFTSITYLSVAETINLPIFTLLAPGHMLVMWDDGINKIYWETTSNREMTKKEYMDWLSFSELDIKNGLFFRKLNRKQLYSYAYVVAASTIHDWNMFNILDEKMIDLLTFSNTLWPENVFSNIYLLNKLPSSDISIYIDRLENLHFASIYINYIKGSYYYSIAKHHNINKDKVTSFYNKAITNYEKCCYLAPNNNETIKTYEIDMGKTYEELAYSYVAVKNYEKAVYYLEKLVSEYPNNRDIEYHKKNIRILKN